MHFKVASESSELMPPIAWSGLHWQDESGWSRGAQLQIYLKADNSFSAINLLFVILILNDLRRASLLSKFFYCEYFSQTKKNFDFNFPSFYLILIPYREAGMEMYIFILVQLNAHSESVSWFFKRRFIASSWRFTHLRTLRWVLVDEFRK